MGGCSQQRQIKQAESLRQALLFHCSTRQHCHSRDIKCQERCVFRKQLLFALLFFGGSFSVLLDRKIGLSFARWSIHTIRSQTSPLLRASKRGPARLIYARCTIVAA